MLLMVLAMADAPEDKKKLESLFLLYEKMMYRIAYNILHHHQDAELYEVFRQLPKQYGEVLTYHYMNSLPSLVYRCLSFLSRCSMRLTKISCFQGIFHLLFSPKYAILFS